MEDNKDIEPMKHKGIHIEFSEHTYSPLYPWSPLYSSTTGSTISSAPQWVGSTLPAAGTSMLQWSNSSDLITTWVPHCLCRDAIVHGIEGSGSLTFDFVNGAWHEQRCPVAHPPVSNVPDISMEEAVPTSGEFLSEE